MSQKASKNSKLRSVPFDRRRRKGRCQTKPRRQAKRKLFFFGYYFSSAEFAKLYNKKYKLQHSNSNKPSSPKPPARLRLDDLPDKTSSFRSQAGVQAGWQFPELIIEVCLP